MNSASNDKSGYLSKFDGKAIARYAMLPGIIPRIRALGMHFGHFAYLMALVFHSAKLIPLGHPTLSANNIGQFGVRQVIALAANNIRWSWKNIDQIAIFSAVVSAIIMIVIQAGIIALYAVLGTAHASSADSFFTTPAANVPTDVALIFLDQVFGANLDIFGPASQPSGTPVFEGLQAILGLYSMATMVIAVIIVLYYILTVIGEAAKTGTPFGQRFNSLWAPIRLIVALGLLVPLGSGLNSAQYMTLWAAKMGSGLGTQVWTLFTQNVTSANQVISKPQGASTTALVSRIFLNEVCSESYNQIEANNGQSITMLQALGSTSQPVSTPAAMIQAAKDAGMDAVDISWSNKSAGQKATDYTCGHITVSLSEFDLYRDEGLVDSDARSGTGFWNWVFGGVDLADKIGRVHTDIKATYIEEISRIAEAVRPSAQAIAEYKISIDPKPGLGIRAIVDSAGIPENLQSTAIATHENINLSIQTTYESLTQADFGKSTAFDEMVKRGWGAAGLWYGNIGKINQKYMDAVNAAAPTLGTIVGANEIDKPGFFASIFGASRFGLTGNKESDMESALNFANKEYAGSVLSGITPDSPLYADARHESSHSNAQGMFSKSLVWMLGGSELYNMKNEPTLDPMARLMGAGHTMVTRSLWAFGGGTVAGIGGAVLGSSKDPRLKFIGELAGSLAGLFFALAAIGLAAGIFLAYVIPLLPFIYFSFAVIGWVLEIFEAVVAMPLWALAHLRIDGDGMPGQAAIGGYQLILMILMRPALIVMGLIGGYVIFGAAMFFFSTLFNSATSITQQEIAGGSNGAIAIFVYTIIFAFLAYNIATMCFKMIDDVPKTILRWLGTGTQTFGDSRGDPVGGSREMVVGAVAGISTVKQGMSGTTAGIQKARQRNQMRKDGQDPDNPVQSVSIVGGGGASAGSSSNHLGPQNASQQNANSPSSPQSPASPTASGGENGRNGDNVAGRSSNRNLDDDDSKT